MSNFFAARTPPLHLLERLYIKRPLEKERPVEFFIFTFVSVMRPMASHIDKIIKNVGVCVCFFMMQLNRPIRKNIRPEFFNLVY